MALTEDEAIDEKHKSFPIELADKPWPSKDMENKPHTPWQTVARITVGPQDLYSDARQLFVNEQLSFSPWHGLAARQPLGGIMRARRKAYEEGQKHRAQRNARIIVEPKSAEEIPG